MAFIDFGNHRRDHFVLAAFERQIFRHQRAEFRESVKHRPRNQGMRRNDRFAGRARLRSRFGVFRRVGSPQFGQHFPQIFVRFFKRDRFYPSPQYWKAPGEKLKVKKVAIKQLFRPALFIFTFLVSPNRRAVMRVEQVVKQDSENHVNGQ
jgi:hypothetical protein